MMTSLPIHADVYWSTSAGDWSSPANWGGTLPTSNDTAYIINGGTTNVTQLGETCGTLSLGSNAGSGTVQMTGGSLSVISYECVGNSGLGTFMQSGGTNNPGFNGDLILAGNPGSSGSYNLSGSGLLSSPWESVGYSGRGTFTQSGGTNTMNSNMSQLDLGRYAGGSGAYNLSGSGLLSAGTEYVGYSGTGTFTQSGGTNGTSSLYLGYNAGGSGTYNLSGLSGLSSAQFQYVGYSGTGTVHAVRRDQQCRQRSCRWQQCR